MHTNIKARLFGIAFLGLLISTMSGCDRGEEAKVTSAEAEKVDPALPQGKVAKFDQYTLRVNAVPSNTLPEASVEQYEIEPASDIGLLNVVVLERQADGKDQPVRAEVSARHEDLTGLTEMIEIRSVEADGYVSYVGTFALEPQDHFQFTVEAKPEGSEKTYTVELDARFKELE